MHLFLQATINGLLLGAVYAIIALGLTLVFGILDIVNFAHGTMFLVGSYLVYQGVTWGYGYVTAFILAVLVLAAFGGLADFVLFARVRSSPISGLLLSIGLISIGANLIQSRWGPGSLQLTSPISVVFRPGGVAIPGSELLVLAVSIVAMLGLAYFLRSTRFGKAFRATAENTEAAVLMGISVERIRHSAFAIGAGLAGVAGGLLAIVQPISPGGGDQILVKGFIVLIVGGAGRPAGAVLAGTVFGLAESFATTYWSASASYNIEFIFLIIVLVLRPAGLLSMRAEVSL